MTMHAYHPLLRLPRRTIRIRLTALYGGLFLVAGIGLLAITYLLVVHSTGDFVFLSRTTNNKSGVASQPGSTRNPGLSTPVPASERQFGIFVRGPVRTDSLDLPDSLRQAENQMQQLKAQAARQHANMLSQLLIQSGIALSIMAVVSIGLGWLIAGRALRPLRTITAAARDISASNLHERLALDGPEDEIKELGNTFDGLLSRLEASFEAQRRFVANASHELRTPLTRQRTLVEIALGDPDATVESLRASYERVLAATEQQERLIEALLTLARTDRGLERREPLDLALVADEILLARHQEAQRRELRVDSKLDAAPASGDSRLVQRLVANLVDNALRHNAPGGHLAVTTASKSGHAILSVVNSGPVVPAADLERLFQPFQRLGADRTGHRDGLGLGLSIVQAIATAHGAALTAQAQPDGGLAVTVRFPRLASGG